ncbi:MAG: DegV family protein [Lachnospiraceae bacterium]|nr:DegV family protein [Lachnospiraceae bacterium]
MEKLYDGDINLRERLLRIILVFSVITTALFVMAGPFMGISTVVILPMVLVLTAASLSLFLVRRYKKIDLAACLMGLIINGLLLPVIYFTSGGLEGGALVWFVFGVVYVYLMFSGRQLLFFLLWANGSFLLTMYASYLHPEWVTRSDVTVVSYVSCGLAILVVGTAIGVLIKFQKGGYDKENELANQQKIELERMSRSKSAFFANMSHEIRTPINTIIGLNEMILREEISDEIAENAMNIQNASKMLLALINDILDLSKLESGKMEIVPVQYETGAMFSDLVNIIWIRAHEKGLEFKLDIAADIPSMLYGDEVRIKQVLTNILTNAVKYTEKGSVTLSAKGERVGNNKVLLRISVEDTGIGIRKESVKELFSSFRRVDEEKNRNIEGTGLGLSISKQLIEMMGGEISVDSIYTRGSVFTVTVEQDIVDANPVGSVDFMIRKKSLYRERYKQSFEAPEARVLIVDDNEMNLMVACKLLRATRVQVDTAVSGKKCLEMTKTKAYHVIFMDHMMPEMDGEETLRLLKQQENGHCQDVPVVALTANVMNGAEKIYRDKGFAGYLAKPISGALLEATLLKYIPRELIEYSVQEAEKENARETIKLISPAGKRKVMITTDCVCDLPEAWLEQFGVKVMYYYVLTKEGRFCDGREVSSDSLLKYLEQSGNTASSSAASVKEYEAFMAGALGEADKVLHISMASAVGEGFQNATAASKGFDNVRVFNSGHLSSGMGLLVLYAAKMAKDGCGVEEICKKLEMVRGKISTSFIVSSADSLYRNQKIGKGVMKLCHTWGIHPVLYLSQNRIKVQGVKIGKGDTAFKRYIRHQLRHRKQIDTRILFLTYAGCSLKQLKQIQEEVAKYVRFDRIVLQKASATISSNCGIGAFGLIFMKKIK